MTGLVVALGEALVELRTTQPLRTADTFRLSYSGDVLNAAAASAAAGARTTLFSVVGADELGDAILDRAGELGVEVDHVVRAPQSNGLYMVSADVVGDREFVYWRAGSAGSTLSPAHVDAAADLFASAAGLVVSGITMAISASARDAALAAMKLVADAGGVVAYDPNVRPKLTGLADARDAFAAAAPLATVVTPSCPTDARLLFDTDDPEVVAARCLALGARAVTVTCGARDVLVTDGSTPRVVPVPPNPDPVDATGAGDVFAGTLTARLVAGDQLADAVHLAAAAASLSVSGLGGTGHIPALAETRRHANAGVRTRLRRAP
ncbi:MAG: bifunctional hydroxymethylpyrimidine kinase/phosphomethylpyrimidine kinase [Streptosporangiales bacterium]|nr:bifunctional hydroxymethylpyrimidine kinase/phosphomethylpyrimidine kinase [Streptosporangiales bacterium]MBO0889334.1 bifunctional hydroxymethylpyrimidine kinase/phosphomethylpyrimidine kinase [Acidothermales bacterium]